jgi:hypothetical protein
VYLSARWDWHDPYARVFIRAMGYIFLNAKDWEVGLEVVIDVFFNLAKNYGLEDFSVNSRRCSQLPVTANIITMTITSQPSTTINSVFIASSI